MHATVDMEIQSLLVGNFNLPVLHSVFTLPGSGSLHSSVAGSGIQLMLVHDAIFCTIGTKPGMQL